MLHLSLRFSGRTYKMDYRLTLSDILPALDTVTRCTYASVAEVHFHTSIWVIVIECWRQKHWFGRIKITISACIEKNEETGVNLSKFETEALLFAFSACNRQKCYDGRVQPRGLKGWGLASFLLLLYHKLSSKLSRERPLRSVSPRREVFARFLRCGACT